MSGTRRTSKLSRASRSRSPSRPRPKRNVSPAATVSAPIAAQHLLGELLRRERSEPSSNAEDEDVLDSGVREQLEPALERREELDAPPSTARGCGSNVTTPSAARPCARRRSRVGGRGGRRRRSRRHATAAPPAARPVARDVHAPAPSALPPLAPAPRPPPEAVGGERVRRNSVGHRERPDAFAAAPRNARRARRDRADVGPRADVRSSVTLSPVYAMTSSACTVDRRIGISASTPRRASLYARSPPILTADAAGIGPARST